MSPLPSTQRRNPSGNGTARDRKQPRPPHRERDFGVGYGNSSGYAPADGQHYAQHQAIRYFRCG